MGVSLEEYRSRIGRYTEKNNQDGGPLIFWIGRHNTHSPQFPSTWMRIENYQ